MAIFMIGSSSKKAMHSPPFSYQLAAYVAVEIFPSISR